MPPFEKYQKSFSNCGYVLIPSLFTSKDVSLINTQLPFLKKQQATIIFENDGCTIRSIMSYHNKNDILNRYTCDSRVLSVVENLLNTKVYVSQSKINLKKGEKGKRWDFHRGFTFWHLLDGKPKPNMISVFICLTKQTIQNGAMYVLTGSHKGFDINEMHEESEMVDDSRTSDTASSLSIQIKDEYIEKYKLQCEKVYLEGDIGDVFFMDSRLLHASDDNHTNNSRDLMITVYNSIDNLPTNNNRPDYLCERDFTPLKPFRF